MQHSEILFMQMKDTVLHRMQNPGDYKTHKKHYSYEHLADDMNARGCRTVRGKSITASNIRKLVSDCNKLDDSEDFRQNYYPDFLEETMPTTIWDYASTDAWNEPDAPTKSDEKLERFSYAIIGNYL
jgi:hypothetical protein